MTHSDYSKYGESSEDVSSFQCNTVSLWGQWSTIDAPA